MLFLPFLVIFTIPWFNIAPFDQQVKELFSASGGNGLNALGVVVTLGSLVLLPIAFVVNLSSMVSKSTVDTRRAFRFPSPLSLILGCSMLFFILMLASWMVVESFNCSVKGICD